MKRLSRRDQTGDHSISADLSKSSGVASTPSEPGVGERPCRNCSSLNSPEHNADVLSPGFSNSLVVGVLADAGTIKLRRRIPYHVAVEMLMTGRWMDAAEAKHWGLANYVVPQGMALDKARAIARQLADGPPLLYPAIKQLLQHSEKLAEHEAFALHDSLHAVQAVIRSEDLKEGARAFSTKRKPVWTGK